MRVLVTGASSMIGHHVVDRLVARGDHVTVLQRRPSRRHDVDEVLGDVADADTVERATQRVDGVIHVAARVGITGSWAEFEATNVHGTRRLLRAACANGVQRFVHVSTPSVAHTGTALVGAPAGPADPDNVRGHYATSKAVAELEVLAAADRLAVVAVRPHLVIGPGDTQLVERVVDRARSGRLAFVGSGLALIDATWVDNAADALVAALDRAEDASGRAVVVSNGQPRTVAELLMRILRAAGVTTPMRHVPAPIARGVGRAVEVVWDRSQRTDDPPMTRFLAEQLSTAHWFDQRETRAVLGWAPRVGLDEGFDRLAHWFETQRSEDFGPMA